MALTIITWILLLLLAGLAVASLRRSGFAYALVVSTYAVEHIVLQGRSGLPLAPWHVNFGMGLVCLASVAAAYNRKALSGYQFHRITYYVFALFAYAAVSISWSPDFDLCWYYYRQTLPYLALFVCLAPLTLYPRKEVDNFLLAMVLLGAATCLGLAFSEIARRAVAVEIGRNQTLQLNPLASGSFGAYTAFSALFLMYKNRTSHIQWRMLLLGVVGLGLFVIAQSGSRGQLLSFVLSSMIWLPLAANVVIRKSSIFALILTLVLSIAGYYSFEALGWADRISAQNIETSLQGRLDMASSLINLWVSGGAFTILFGLGNSSSYPLIGMYTHIVPLEVLAEEGVLMLFLFLLFAIQLYRFLFSAINSPAIEKDDRINICFLGALATFEFILCLKQGSLLGQTPLFCFAFGGICAVQRLKLSSVKLGGLAVRPHLRSRQVASPY